ncbi:MAG: transketolase [Hyphomicrobiales bacterium]|jgi:transketolase|nr:transketolase [Hyphomicrobiales bacterium]
MLPTIDAKHHALLANAIRTLAMDAVEQAKSGHPGLPMGAADVATVLFSHALKFDAAQPEWPDRDRFVLSAGHGSMLVYALLYLTGTPGMTLDEIKRFRQLHSRTPGHPEVHHTRGVEMTTGPLGQGIATAVGMAMAERMLAAEFGKAVVNHHTYVLASDGDLMEGISQEAIALAGHQKLNRLIVLFDDNGISIDGPLSIADSVDQIKRFQSAGWRAERVDGHDPAAILAAINRAKASAKPSLIACKTIIGYGAPKRAGTSKAHGEPLGADELAGAKARLGLSPTPFDVPAEALKAWRAIGARGAPSRLAWAEAFARLSPRKRDEFNRRLGHQLPPKLGKALSSHKAALVANPPTIATRKASEMALEAITPVMPELLLGSADLTPSNNTKMKTAEPFTARNPKGRYVHYGIREHGMAAAMNGIALHGGFRPAGATFMVFTDYCRPAIRLAALMNQPVIYVMTHDSIGLGEDGPTHQPVEHLAALRAIPNLRTLRPADAMETAECWQLALERTDGPTVLALTRQNLTPVRREATRANLCATGAYELLGAEGGRAHATIFATGSEIEIAVASRRMLAEKGIRARIVSVPSLELFLSQPAEARAKIIGQARIKVAVEAGIRMGWDAVIGADGLFVGMSTFGASAPYKELYRLFGITPEAVADAVTAKHIQ